MSQPSTGRKTTAKKKHVNKEKVKECPACGETFLSRSLHLHVLRKDDEAHGPQGDIPPTLDLENAPVVGTREVEMDYPETRETEKTRRQCPYCTQTFKGKQGLGIHFGQVVGRKNHPADREQFPDPGSCPVVHVDEDGNIIEVVEEGITMPSTQRRQDTDEVNSLIKDLREKGKTEEAEAMQRIVELVSG